MSILALILMAQIRAHAVHPPTTIPHINRVVILDQYGSMQSAAAAYAQGGASMISTGSGPVPSIRFTIIYADFFFLSPPIRDVRFVEFSDAYAAADFYSAGLPRTFQHSGLINTAERTVIVWYFND